MAKTAVTFPDIILSTQYIAQQQYGATNVVVLQINDNPANQTLTAFCQLGSDPSFKYWVPVLSGEDYTVNWTNDTVTKAVQAYFVNTPA